MTDPLQPNIADKELFTAIARLCLGRPLGNVLNVSVNLLVNAIRQDVAMRKDAEAIIDELLGKAKTTLLEQHYDATTGKRRNVFPFTQRVKAPFLDGKNDFFRG